MNQLSTPEQMTPDLGSGRHAGLGFRGFVVLMAAIMAVNALSIDTMLPALPDIGRSLHVADENARQWIITAFLLGFGVAQIAYGPLSDRYGRRPVLVFGLVGYIVTGIGVSLTPSFPLLLAFRVLQGVAVAATRVVTISVVRDCYGGRQMARVMSLVFMIFLAVPVLAPSIGQIIMLFFPWRGLFAALAVYGAIVLAAMLARLPETLHPEFRRPMSVAAIAGAARLVFANRQAMGYMLAATALSGALFGFINSVQQIFADVFHHARLMPALFAAIGATMAGASLLNSRIVEQLGTRRVSHSALLGFIAVQTVHLAIVLTGHEEIVTFTLFQAMTMFCFGLATSNFSAMTMEPLAAVAGTAASLQGFVTTVGGALLGFGIGQSFDASTRPVTIGFVLLGSIALVCVLFAERGRLFRPQMGD